MQHLTNSVLASLFFLFFATSSAFAQNLTENDAIILEEANEINISSKKLSFIHYYFLKTQKVVVKSEKGIKEFSKIHLPENHDPTYIYHAPKVRNYQFLLSAFKPLGFEIATINKKDTVSLDVEKIDSTIQMVNSRREFGNYRTTIYKPKNIKIGDTLLIKYKYSAKYAETFSILGCYRVFFNSHIPKKKYALTVKHNERLRTEFKIHNFIENAVLDTVDEIVSHTWSTENLEGCLLEKGAIPFRELPNITIIPKPVELIYTIPSTWQETYLPFYIFPVYQREKRHFVIYEAVKDGVSTKQYAQLYKFVDKFKVPHKEDSTGYKTLLELHNKIVDDFSYKNDYQYFTRQEIRGRERIGDYLTAETFRDLSRYDTYVGILLNADLAYLTAYPVDKRVGVISDDYFRPMFENDFFIAAILNNNIVQYILPKKHKFGYYANEMPFYYENSNVRLISIFDYIVYKTAINKAVRQAKTPGSSFQENLRTTNSMVKVSLDSLSLDFMTKVNLAGQFSTMTRGIYTHGYADPTVNPKYNDKVWEINENVKLQKVDAKVTKKIFPFNASINATYSSNNILTKEENLYKLNLKNWFNHIIYDNIAATVRTQDFYPDFLFRDTYNYMLQFDHDIELKPIEKIRIKNEFAELIIDVTQLNPKQIRISSIFSVIAGKVPADKFSNVKDVYSKIEALDNSILEITKK